MEEAVIKRLDRIERKLSELLLDKKQNKGTWVKVSIIQQFTGWDKRKLETARVNGLVEHRKTAELGHEYLLESIPQIFLNKQ